MTKMDIMALYCVMTRRKINLDKLIMDHYLSTIERDKRKNVGLPYGKYLTGAFNVFDLNIEGEKVHDIRRKTTWKTFTMLGYKFPKGKIRASHVQKEAPKQKILPQSSTPLETTEIVAKFLSDLGFMKKKKKKLKLTSKTSIVTPSKKKKNKKEKKSF